MVLLGILATAACILAVIFWSNHHALEARKARLDTVLTTIYTRLESVQGATDKDTQEIDFIRDACLDPEGVLGSLLIEKKD